jgi:hypothetical protein
VFYTIFAVGSVVYAMSASRQRFKSQEYQLLGIRLIAMAVAFILFNTPLAILDVIGPLGVPYDA